jgi:hypothetical protein
MDEAHIQLWFEKIKMPDGTTFKTAEEYNNYMTVHRLWGPHPDHTMTQAEWEVIKAKRLAETGEVLGTVKFEVSTSGEKVKEGKTQ